MIRNSTLLLALLILSQICLGQNAIDSLKIKFSKEQDDSLKMELAYTTAIAYYRRGQGDSALKYNNAALDFAKKLRYEDLIYEFTLSVAQVYGRMGKKDLIFAFADSAMNVAKSYNLMEGQVKVVIFKGETHTKYGNYGAAVNAYDSALTMARTYGITSLEATCLNNLSIEYRRLGDEETSIEYLIESVKIREEENSRYLGTSYANLANAYKRQERLDEAIAQYKKALKLLEDPQFTDNRVVCLRNLGDTYTRLEKYNKARKLLKESHNLVLTKDNDPMGQAMYFFLSSTIYQNQGSYDSVLICGEKVIQLIGNKTQPLIRSSNFTNMANASLSLALNENTQAQKHLDKAVEYGEQAIALAKQSKSYPQIIRVTKVLIKVYGQTSNAAKAIEYAELYGNSIDSLNKIEQNKKVVAMQTKFDVEKKEFQIDLLQKESELAQTRIDKAARENETQLYFLLLIGFTLFIFIALAILLYRQVNLKNKANGDLSIKNDTITKQNEEKELLLKEIHHRVKNNLQVVSSLLDLQSKKAADGEKEALAEGQSRVRAMALIHEKLYQSNNVSTIDFAQYCNELSRQIAQLFPHGKNVECDIEMVDIFLDIDTAVPLGLILNELITNAHKYAFADGTGRLRIRAHKEQNNSYILYVEDNGKGLSDDFDWRKSKSLGLRLVNRLARQLYGKAEYSKGENSTFEITFKDTLERKKIA